MNRGGDEQGWSRTGLVMNMGGDEQAVLKKPALGVNRRGPAGLPFVATEGCFVNANKRVVHCVRSYTETSGSHL